MIFSSLAILLSSISLYVGNTDVSSQYGFTKHIYNDNLVHCYCYLNNIQSNTLYQIRAYQDDDTYGRTFQQMFELEFNYHDNDLVCTWGYYGKNSNYSFYGLYEIEDENGNTRTGTFDMTYAYKYDSVYNDLIIDTSGTNFTLNDTDCYFSFDVYFMLLDENIFTEYFNQDDGSNQQYITGYENGYDAGQRDGESTGYRNGFEDAKEQYENTDSYINSIFGGIVTVGLIPIEFMMSIFNFEILGINFTHVISAILSIMVIVILLRIVLGGKAGKE